QTALEDLMHDRTRFVVAQRISTVLSADKIIVLDKGRVAAEGTHAELLRTSPIYREIYDSQLGAATPEELSSTDETDRTDETARGEMPALSDLSAISVPSVDESVP